MSLEDEFSDVIAKAMRGLEIEPAELAQQAQVSECEISGLLHGDMEQETLRKIAPLLRLDAGAVLALSEYRPEPLEMEGVERIELPFRQWTVNAWQLRKGDTCLLFDAGFGDRDVLEKIDPAELDAVLLTHDHPDHSGGIEALKAQQVAVISEKDAMKRGEISFGNGLSVRAIDLSGHQTPAVGYLVNGFEKPLFVVGDAIFAGSMGRWLNRRDYDLAFETLRAAFSEIPEHCILLPGHGPATTMAQEKTSNPFHPGFCA